jgi:hypothetical protein
MAVDWRRTTGKPSRYATQIVDFASAAFDQPLFDCARSQWFDVRTQTQNKTQNSKHKTQNTKHKTQTHDVPTMHSRLSR